MVVKTALKKQRRNKTKPEPTTMRDDREYESRDYWEQRYSKDLTGDDETDEWYYSFEDMTELFKDEVPLDATVLDIGCGKSTLLKDMRAAGYTGRLIGVDYVKAIIDELRADSPTMEYICADAEVGLPFENATMSVVIDKGTTDALMCDKSGTKAAALWGEIARVLPDGGKWIIISHSHPEKSDLLAQMIVAIDSPYVKWRARIHSQQRKGYPHVYVFSKRVTKKKLKNRFTVKHLVQKKKKKKEFFIQRFLTWHYKKKTIIITAYPLW
eukprot:TRINITY_DN2345_c0_g1_i1.p1 TRINITY_DN2345_c0_g1~~TRINITY_DN2345_c0_g1_i1.p1  ORF type:complete len:269 (-),score=33.20 TRINITY_DN2345_c0_g1_i1:26-832(-)